MSPAGMMHVKNTSIFIMEKLDMADSEKYLINVAIV